MCKGDDMVSLVARSHADVLATPLSSKPGIPGGGLKYARGGYPSGRIPGMLKEAEAEAVSCAGDSGRPILSRIEGLLS